MLSVCRGRGARRVRGGLNGLTGTAGGAPRSALEALGRCTGRFPAGLLGRAAVNELVGAIQIEEDKVARKVWRGNRKARKRPGGPGDSADRLMAVKNAGGQIRGLRICRFAVVHRSCSSGEEMFLRADSTAADRH